MTGYEDRLMSLRYDSTGRRVSMVHYVGRVLVHWTFVAILLAIMLSTVAIVVGGAIKIWQSIL